MSTCQPLGSVRKLHWPALKMREEMEAFCRWIWEKKMDCSLEETEGPQYCRLNFKQLRTTFLVGCVVGSLEILENESALFYAKVCVVLYLLQGANIYLRILLCS